MESVDLTAEAEENFNVKKRIFCQKDGQTIKMSSTQQGRKCIRYASIYYVPRKYCSYSNNLEISTDTVLESR